MLTQVLALTLVGFSNMMKRSGQLLCPISEWCIPVFEKDHAWSVGGECV